MIPDAIVGLVLGALRAMLALIPDWQPPVTSTGEDSLAFQIGQTAGMLSGYFPIVALGAALTAVLGFRVVLTAWTSAVFVYDRLPFKAT